MKNQIKKKFDGTLLAGKPHINQAKKMDKKWDEDCEQMFLK